MPTDAPTSTLRRAVARDRRTISYRPEINLIIGKVTATVLLQQILYYSDLAGDQPFSMFREPCAHEAYQPGGSWTEVLGMTAYELDGAIAVIGTKVTKGISKAEAFAGKALANLVVYWTDASRMTWYQVNAPLADALLEFAYSQIPGNSTFSNYLENLTFSNYLVDGKNPITLTDLDDSFRDSKESLSGKSLPPPTPTIAPAVRSAFERHIGLIASTLLQKQVQQAQRDFPEAWIIEAIEKAGQAGAGKNNWNYAAGILRRWQSEGRDAVSKPSAAAPAPAHPTSPYPPGARVIR